MNIKFGRWALGVGIAVFLAACGSQQVNPSVEVSAFDSVPAQIGQALAVTLALPAKGISSQAAKNTWVTSTLVQAPDGTPVQWANIQTDKNGSFAEAIRLANPSDRVYLTGARKDRSFYGDIFEARTVQQLYAACGNGCRLVYAENQLYVTRGNTWFNAQGEALGSQEVTNIKSRYQKIDESIKASDIPTEMAKRWDRLEQESQPPQPAPSAQGLSDPYNPAPMNLATDFFTGGRGIDAQVETYNYCHSWAFWSCTNREKRGTVSIFSQGFDFGNRQWVKWDWGWNGQLSQNYGNPLASVGQTGSNTTWGAWDFGPSGLWDKGESHIAGCGPVTLLRMVNWYRTAGLISRTFTFRLPYDNLSYSGTSVTVGNNSADNWETTNFVRMSLWPTWVGNNGKAVYNPWVSKRMNGNIFVNGQLVLPKDFQGGGNAWLIDNNSPMRVEGRWLRDIGWGDVAANIIPGINWVMYTQYTWGVSGILQDTIGRENVPAVALYPSGGGGLHYGVASGYRINEFWDYASNFATVDSVKENNPYTSGSSPVEVYLSDFYSWSAGAYRIRR